MLNSEYVLMKPKVALLASVAIFAASVSAPAHAVLLDFSLTGSREATFQLDSNPGTPDIFSTSAFGDQIRFNDVEGTFGGIDGAASIGFGSGLFAALNINGTSLGFTQFAGPALFSGSASAPMFSTGVFQLTSLVSGASTLTISEAAAGPGAIPEPGAWALMITGFGLTGAALRGRRRVQPTVAG
ncbi:MAG: PEPxxWA-CTERM sorting domain-containing protein [Phenylobacterium sp.]|nr:PEPxxWA-CTERM sorting domain-containing protein [Phenylobacterium sp.]